MNEKDEIKEKKIEKIIDKENKEEENKKEENKEEENKKEEKKEEEKKEGEKKEEEKKEEKNIKEENKEEGNIEGKNDEKENIKEEENKKEEKKEEENIIEKENKKEENNEKDNIKEKNKEENKEEKNEEKNKREEKKEEENIIEENKLYNNLIEDNEEQKNAIEEDDIDIFGEIEERRRNNKKSIYCTQTVALMKKSFIVLYRHYKTTILVLSSPITTCVILILLQLALHTWSTAFIEKNPPIFDIEKIRKCPYPNDCVTIMALVLDNSESQKNMKEAEEVMKYVSLKNDLNYGKDIILSKTLKNYGDFVKYFDNNKNKTYFGVIFCYDYLDTEFYSRKFNIPCKPQFAPDGKEYKFYTIVYNVTNGPNDFLQMPYEPRKKDALLMKLKIDIDNAFMEMYHNKTRKEEDDPPPKITVQYSNFPRTEHRYFGETSLVNNFGGPFFFLIPLTLYVLILIDVVREKQSKLRKSLLIIGMTNLSFWTSWLIISIVFSFVLMLLFFAVVYALRWELFVNTPFPIMFGLFFIITIDLQLIAFIMSTLITNVKTAYASAFCFIIVAMVINFIFLNPFIYQTIYAEGVGVAANIYKTVLYLFCPYSFSKAYLEIASIASTKLNEESFMNTPGRPYEYSDLFTVHEGYMVLFKQKYIIPPTYQSFIWLIVDGVIYFIFIFYFDVVIESNRGTSKSPIFFILDLLHLCGLCKKKKKIEEKINNDNEEEEFNDNENIRRNPSLSDLEGFKNTLGNDISEILKGNSITGDDYKDIKDVKMRESVEKGYKTVYKEYSKIINDEKNNVFLDGLRIVGASKTYNLSHGKKLNALENIYLEVSRGELLSLLGHNGAGKTTLINALVGNISITSGYAIINRINITDENVKTDYKRQLIGLCPQHDILWEELTPYEHIELYASIRNYVKTDIKKIVEIKMKEVNLEQVTNDKVSTFSGGMKRRISILLSTVGNPNVVFLDEPSTGLDPVNRHFIWRMIKEIKKKSSVILTSHSMTEAEFLSDRICIIKKGKMQCIGNSLELKNIYGDGYVLTFICEKDQQEKVKNIILGLNKDIKVLSDKGGNLIFSAGFDKIGELGWFIKILNQDFSDEKIKDLKGLVKECSIEQTSIEEIFLKIAKEEGEDITDDEEQNK